MTVVEDFVVDQNDRDEWLKAGFADTDRLAWRAAGFNDPEHASPWFRAGVSPSTACEWRDRLQVPAHEAKLAGAWEKRRFSIAEALDWNAKGIYSPAVAGDWRDAGYSAEEARVRVRSGRLVAPADRQGEMTLPAAAAVTPLDADASLAL